MTRAISEESNIGQYGVKLTELTREQLIKEFERLNEQKKKEQGRPNEGLKMCFTLIITEARGRGINLYATLKPEPLSPVIELTLTPESSSIAGYAYDSLEKILYIKFKSGETVYPYPRVPESIFEGLKSASSKGKFYTSEIRGKVF